MVTKKDIAAHLGISRTAVSLVLNNTPNHSISAETRDKILEAAKDLGYRKHNMTPRLCFVLYNREADDLRYMKLLKETEAVAAEQNCGIAFMNVTPDPTSIQRLRDAFAQKELEGFIITGDLDDQILHLFKGANVPYIFFAAQPSVQRQGYNSITFDSRKVFYHATRYLLSLGHTRIALFSGSLDYEFHQLYLAGYRDALEEAGIGYNISYVQISDEENGYELCKRAHILQLPFTAALCSNSIIQFGALQYLQSIGVDVPKEISLVGSGFPDLVKLVRPQLTSFDVPHGGYEVMIEQLLGLINGSVQSPIQIWIDDYSFFEGGSVAPCTSTDKA